MRGRIYRHGLDPGTGVPWLDEPGEDEVVVRLSRAIGLPGGLPDIHGLAVRVPLQGGGHGDLLFASTGWGRLSRFVLTASRSPQARPMTTLLPYHAPSGPSCSAPAPAGRRRSSCPSRRPAATGGPFADLRFSLAPSGDGPVDFDPVANRLPGLEQYPSVAALREPSYRRGPRLALTRLGRPRGQAVFSSLSAVAASSMIRAHRPLGGGAVAEAHRARHLVVQRDRLRVRPGRHHPVVGAAAEDLLHDAVERAEHLVAAGLEQRAVEDRVGQQVGLQVAVAAVDDHVGHRGGEDPAVVGGRALGGQGGGHRLDAAAQLGQGEQLLGPVAAVEAPADHPGVEDVPLVPRLDRDPHPASGRDQPHRLQDPDRLAGDAAGHGVLLADVVEREHLSDRERAGRDPAAERGEDGGVLSGRGVGHGIIMSPQPNLGERAWLICRRLLQRYD